MAKNGSPPRTRPLYNAQDQRASIVSIVCLYAAPRCLRIFNLKHEFPYGFVVPELRILPIHFRTEKTKLFISVFPHPSLLPSRTTPCDESSHPIHPWTNSTIYRIVKHLFSPRLWATIEPAISNGNICPTWRQRQLVVRGQTNRWRRTIATINHRPNPCWPRRPTDSPISLQPRLLLVRGAKTSTRPRIRQLSPRGSRPRRRKEGNKGGGGKGRGGGS